MPRGTLAPDPRTLRGDRAGGCAPLLEVHRSLSWHSPAGGGLRSVGDDLTLLLVATVRLFAQRTQGLPHRADVKIPLGIVEEVVPSELLRFAAGSVQRYVGADALPLDGCAVLGRAMLDISCDSTQVQPSL